ncbi:hypothetical protein ACTOVL_05870 [Arcanobacterium canis]
MFLMIATEPTSTLGQIGKFLAGLGIFLYALAEAIALYKNRKDKQ